MFGVMVCLEPCGVDDVALGMFGRAGDTIVVLNRSPFSWTLEGMVKRIEMKHSRSPRRKRVLLEELQLNWT